MSIMEIGQALVAAANAGAEAEGKFVDDYYADNVISIEGSGSDEMPARIDGVDAVRGKHAWFFGNNEVHSTVAEGPYIGNREDQFVVRYILDMTPTGGERGQMTEIGLYTVADGKIAQEEYLYLMG